MAAKIVLFCTFLFGLFFTIKGYRPVYVWLLSCLLIPIFVLADVFFLPPQGAGAALWPIALQFGSLLGAMAGGFGVGIGILVKERIDKKEVNN